MAEKKLFLVDGMAIIYRAFFAFSKNPRMTSYGMNTSAVFGFGNTIIELLNKENPTHMAVVFDTAAPTERHEIFPEYKAQREAMPEDLALSIPYVRRLIEGFNIPVITKDGFEADDIIGTLSKQAEKEGYTVYMMTPDKDFAQLVSENIFMYKPARMGNGIEILGVDEVKEKWSISRVDQVIDILGLWGDSVDNIPGVPGVGEKTAKKLIAEYGSMENIIDHIHELKGKMKEKFEQNIEQALLSKKLATIILDVPVDFHEEEFKVEDPDEAKLKELFGELEFRTMHQRIFGKSLASTSPSQPSLFDAVVSDASASQPEPDPLAFKTIENTDHDYKLVETKEDRAALISELLNSKEFCFDSETTSLNELDAEILGLAFSMQKGTGYYVVFPRDENESREILSEFAPVFDSDVLKIAQNAKYDVKILAKYGQIVSEPVFDTMLAHYIVSPDQRHNMDALSENYLNYKPISITELIGKKGKGQLTMDSVDIEKVKEYAVEDADITLQLKEKLAKELKEKSGEKIFNELEIPLINVLAKMEHEGIRIDSDFLNNYSEELGVDIASTEKSIYEDSGVKFNIASPKQLGEVLFDKLKLVEKPKKTKTGQYQTGEEILVKLADKHDIVQKILDFRQLQKLKSTYVDALPELVHPKTGRIHTSFNQAVAATGRLSSNNPNLQNIPIRTERGRKVRQAFIARDENHVLLAADYSQVELRVIASVSGDEGMKTAFKQGLDIHTATAAKVFGVDTEEVDREMRRKAKMVNFGIIYGVSAFGLAERLSIPRGEAKEIIDNYFMQFPNIKKYMDDTIVFARDNEFVQTIMGRRRYIKDINSRNHTVRGFAERNAINAPIQGAAADMIKLAMISIDKKLNGYRTKMILQVHDELLFDVPREEMDIVKPIIVKEMEEAMPLDVPVVVDTGMGNNWLEAH
jgi:DNA polymerase-1